MDSEALGSAPDAWAAFLLLRLYGPERWLTPVRRHRRHLQPDASGTPATNANATATQVERIAAAFIRVNRV